jgi:branched-chain amino acid transport system permease protein
VPDVAPFLVVGLALGSVYALSGVGLVVLYRTTGVINFAYGAIGALGALVAWSVVDAGGPLAVAVLAAIGTTIAVSVMYGVAIARRLATRNESVKATATLGLALLLLGFAAWAWRDEPRSFGLPSDDVSMSVLGVRVVATKLVALGLCTAITVGVGLVLRRTRGGLGLRAMAADRELSGLLGIQVTRLGMTAWALAGLLSGVSGLLLANLVRLDAPTLTFLVIEGVAAATIGRLQSLPMTLVGGLTLGVVEALATPFDRVSNYRGVLPFVVAIAWILWAQRRSAGAVLIAASR